MPSRWTSRKFLLSLGTQLAALAALLWPNHTSEVAQASQSVTALVVLLLSTLGYVQAEGAIDKERAAATDPVGDVGTTNGAASDDAVTPAVTPATTSTAPTAGK